MPWKGLHIIALLVVRKAIICCPVKDHIIEVYSFVVLVFLAGGWWTVVSAIVDEVVVRWFPFYSLPLCS